MSKYCPHDEEYGPGFACPPCIIEQVGSLARTTTVEIGEVFSARWPGMCAECEDDFEPGDRVRYVMQADTKLLWHERCSESL